MSLNWLLIKIDSTIHQIIELFDINYHSMLAGKNIVQKKFEHDGKTVNKKLQTNYGRGWQIGPKTLTCTEYNSLYYEFGNETVSIYFPDLLVKLSLNKQKITFLFTFNGLAFHTKSHLLFKTTNLDLPIERKSYSLILD